MGTTNNEKPFEAGELIEYCDERLEVVKNFGDSGIVKYPNDDSGDQFPYRWNAYGAICTRVDQ